jgi:hypothetical protein
VSHNELLNALRVANVVAKRRTLAATVHQLRVLTLARATIATAPRAADRATAMAAALRVIR